MHILLQFVALLVIFTTKGSANPVLLPSFASSNIVQKDDSTSNCPTGYSQPANSNWNYCYRVHTDFVSRDDAAAQCKAENGTLASIGDAFVNSYIYSLGKQEGALSIWFGIECFNGSITNCVNDDNSNAAYTNFYPGQPASFEYCVWMSTYGQASQSWATDFCRTLNQFVCEVPTGVYGKTKCLYGWTEYQGQCYKKFNTVGGITRDEAAEQCTEAPGGLLATINSQQVNDFITALPIPNTIVRIGLQCPNATKKGDTSTCKWDDGTPFSYNNFAAGQPVPSSTKYFGYAVNGQWHADVNSNSGFEFAVCQSPLLDIS